MISYQEALKALNSSEGGTIVHIGNVASNMYNMGFEIVTENHKLIMALENGDVQKCLMVLSNIF